MYFSFFPNIQSYPITINSGDFTDQYSGNISFKDIFRNISVVNIGKTHQYYFQKERILNGERPDQLSTRLYGTPNYFWTFFIINDHLRLGENLQWPIEETRLRNKLTEDYTGHALISYKSRYVLGFRPKLVFLRDNAAIYKQFIPGETLIGESSGARASFNFAKNELGQMIVTMKTTEVRFRKNESIVGETSGSRIFIHDTVEYLEAPMYYVDDEGRECSHPNFLNLNETNINETLLYPVSIKDHFLISNESLSVINAIPKSSILKFENNFRSLISSRSVFS